MKELVLVPFASIQYGIWKDDIRSVRSLDALHRIPLSPACIAGIMINGGHTVTLANLPVCIGSGSTQEIKQGCILLMEEGEKPVGFVVDGELGTQSISPQLIFTLPEYLKTPVFEACAVHDNIPIPLINIAELHSRVLKPGEDTSVDSFRISGVQPLDISGMDQIRFISVGGELFAASATGMEEKTVKPGPITPLPNTPQYVKGITFCNGRLLPIIDLSQRINWQAGSPESLMLVAGIGDAAFGLLIDSDEGTVSADKFAIEPVPFIVQTAWLKHMVVRAEKLVPLIDLAMALSQGSADDEKPVWQRYAPDSAFPEIFFKDEVEVMEFSILGELYALPGNEVEDVIFFKPCRALPGLPPIVIGVTEHNGEILPVVDLAMMFGRRSLATPTWRMLLVKNGDFRALVITETVSGGRRLPPEIHRTVPIHLPHNLMYGCYPDGKAARIILNVEAISVHFEKSLIKKFLPTLSHEMKMSPTAVVYALPGEKTSGAPQALATETPAATRTTVETQTLAETMDQSVITTPVKTIVPARAEEKVPIRHAEAEPASEITPEAEPGQMVAAGEATPPAGAHLSLPKTDGMNTLTSPEPVHVTKHDAAETLSKTIMPEIHLAEVELTKPIVALHNTSNQQRSSEMDTKPATVPPADGSAALKPIPAVAGRDSGTLHRINREVEQLSSLTLHEEHTSGPWKRGIAYGATAAALIAVLLYFPATSDKHGLEKSVKASWPAKIEQTMGLPVQTYPMTGPFKTKAEQTKEKAEQARMQAGQTDVQTRAELEAKRQQDLALTQQTKAQTELPRPIDKTHAPLELVIPKNMPKIDIEEYVVVQGDTLWSISERFTGNPFNYPRIAGGNRIANPNLIFPGQRIRLIR